MRRSRLALLLAIVGLGALWLTGCGQMGPLTRPEATAAAGTATPADEDAQNSDTQNSDTQGSDTQDSDAQNADDQDRDEGAHER